MVSLKFDFRDLFRASRVAFSFQRLWIQFTGFLTGYGLYLVLTYAGAVLSGENLATIWARHGLLPDCTQFHLAWYGWILVGLGILSLAVAWLVTATAVARAAYMNLKGNTFYTWKEAFNFALKKKIISVIATPVAIFAIAFFTKLGGVLVGLISRIPIVGEIGISVLTLVWFVLSFFIVFVLAACVVSLLLTPAILATTDDDAFEGIFQSFSTLFSQPWRLVIYEVIVGGLSVFSFLVFAVFAKFAWGVMTSALITGMGSDYESISYQAVCHLQNWLYPAVVWMKSSGWGLSLFLSETFTSLDLGGVLNVAALITGIFVTVIAAYVFSYLLATFNVGNTLIFLVLKKIKDDENLLERKDKEEEDEDLDEENAESSGEEKSHEAESKEEADEKPE